MQLSGDYSINNSPIYFFVCVNRYISKPDSMFIINLVWFFIKYNTDPFNMINQVFIVDEFCGDDINIIWNRNGFIKFSFQSHDILSGQFVAEYGDIYIASFFKVALRATAEYYRGINTVICGKCIYKQLEAIVTYPEIIIHLFSL